MKKLLITTDCFLPRWDGIARFLSQITPELKEYKITIIAPDFEGRKRKDKVIRIPLMKKSFGDITFSKFHYKEIKKEAENNDIVFNHTIGPIGICTILAARKLGKPIISYIHSIDWELTSKGVKYFKTITKYIVRKLAIHLYNKCNLLLVPSNQVEDILTYYGVKTKKTILKLGVKTNKFIPAQKRKQKKFIIGFCGRLGREKDIETLYSAFKILQEKHKNLLLLIVGTGIEYYDKLKKDKNVLMTGAKDNVVPYLQAMDVYVLPSLTETTSLSTMEAMSCGIPVITTPVGSIPEYVQDGFNGFLFPRKDPKTLSEKIEILINNPKLRKKLGENARKTIIKHHKLDNTIKEIKNVLKIFSGVELNELRRTNTRTS